MRACLYVASSALELKRSARVHTREVIARPTGIASHATDNILCCSVAWNIMSSSRLVSKETDRRPFDSYSQKCCTTSKECCEGPNSPICKRYQKVFTFLSSPLDRKHPRRRPSLLSCRMDVDTKWNCTDANYRQVKVPFQQS